MGIPSALTSQTPPAGDQANAVVSGQFQANAVAGAAAFSAIFSPWGPFNVVFGATGGPNGAWTGSLQLERSFDGGTTWFVCGLGGAGQQAVWITGTDVSVVFGEPERSVLYRLHATALTVGNVNYRLSQSGGAAMSLANPSPV
jgi:hypothetical protein